MTNINNAHRRTDKKPSVQPGPEKILEITHGFIASKFLFEASELGLFEKLGDQSLTVHEISEKIAIPERSTRMLVDAVTSIGLLENLEGGKYQNGQLALSYLSGKSQADLNPYLRYSNRIRYPSFARLGDALKERRRVFNTSGEQQEIYSAGIEALNAGIARSLAVVYDFSRHKRVIDLGGGTGSFLIPICSRYSQIECALFELPDTARVAGKRLAKKTTNEIPLVSRIKIIEGDLLKDRIPRGYDAFVIANVIHVFSPEHVKDLLTNVRKSASAGASLLLVDFWTDVNHIDPPIAALLAGAFLLYSGEGDVYSLEEIKDWLKQTGWRFKDHTTLAGPQSLVIAEA